MRDLILRNTDRIKESIRSRGVEIVGVKNIAQWAGVVANADIFVTYLLP